MSMPGALAAALATASSRVARVIVFHRSALVAPSAASRERKLLAAVASATRAVRRQPTGAAAA